MKKHEEESEANERAALEARIEECRAEIRRRLIALVEHPEIPEVFKNSRVVVELVR